MIHIHNIVLCDWQYFTEYSPYLNRIQEHYAKIVLVPHNIVMDMNNVMYGFSHRALIYKN